MSQAAAASGGGMTGSGDDNPEEKKGKGMFGKNIPEDSPVLPLTSSSDDEESDDQGGDDNQPAAKIRGGKRSTLDCLASLEASLPMKRGISSNYCGKSKSYGNLSEVGVVDAKELGKKEHAVNKRRRLLIAHEYPDVVTHGNTSASAPAILPLPKDEDEDEDKDGGDGDHSEKKHEEDGNK